MPYPSCVEVIVVWLCAIPLCIEVIIILALCLASCVEVACFGERSCILQVCNYETLGGGSLYGRSYVDIVKILLCEGEDVEQWLDARNISWYLCLIHYL